MTSTRNASGWTRYELNVLVSRYPDELARDVAAVLRKTVSQVYQKANALGLKKSASFNASDRSARIQRGKQHEAMVRSRFQPGLTPWNKGRPFDSGGRSAETRFKKGEKPHTWVPVGTYRVNCDGALELKVNDLPGANHVRWHPVARLVWVEAFGPVPKGHVVVFRAGMRTVIKEEITVDRLECITRGELACRNHPRSRSPELGRLVQLKGAITRQVNRIVREHNESQP